MSANYSGTVTSPLHDQPLLPHLIVRSLAAHDDAPCIHLAGRVASYARDPATDQPADPGPAGARRDARDPPRRAVEEPSGGAHEPDGVARQRLRGDAAPPDGLARRPRLRDRRCRDRMPRLRRRQLHRACTRAQGAVPGSHAARLRTQRRRRRLPRARRPVRAGAARRPRRRSRRPVHRRLHRRHDRTARRVCS